MNHTRQQRICQAWTRGMIGALILQCMILLPQTHAQTNPAIVYLDSLRQVISGFGAANIVPWRPDMNADNILKAFGTGPGQIGFSLLRLRIPYQTSEFALNVPAAQAAYGIGVKVFASPWTPPAWMKTSNNIVGGRLYDTSYASYAAHLKSFVDFMSGNGVPLHAVSLQNEPDIQVTYESCDWNGAEFIKFLKEQGTNVGTKIIVPESFNFNHTMSDAILNDSSAASKVDIIGGHIYGGGLTAYPLVAAKGKEFWMTEHLVLDTTWTAVFGTGKEIYDCMNAGMNAYIWWYIVRFYGPIHENGYVTKRGYVMSQYSRFIRPGYHRVLTTIPRGKVFLTGYKSSSKLVIVALNTDTSKVAQTISLQNLWGTAASVTPYVTSSTKDCQQGSVIPISDGSFTDTLDASSVTTFVANVVVGVKDVPDVPHSYMLSQNYPNPFNPVTVIRFELPVASRVSLTVTDLLGREVATLVRGELAAGYHQTEWNAQAVASGLYFYRLEVTAIQNPEMVFVETRKMLLLR